MASLPIYHNVTLFPQPTGYTCWSAATTMLFNDRSIGPGDAQHNEDGSLKPEYQNVAKFAAAYGLTLYAPQTWTIDSLLDVLQYNPVACFGSLPNLHAIVLGGATGDGSHDGTQLKIFDPWPVGRGEIKNIGYGLWLKNFPEGTTYILQR